MHGIEDVHTSSFIMGMRQFCSSMISTGVSSVATTHKVLLMMLMSMSSFEMSIFDARMASASA